MRRSTAMPMLPPCAQEPLRQVFIGRAPTSSAGRVERKSDPYTASANIQRRNSSTARNTTFRMSSSTVVYKGLLLADQVGVYYKDLSDERCVSALGLVHQRFSTNTFPKWPLAHPYRYVAHNGEINTVKGNYNWMKAREGVMSSPVLQADLKKLYPISFADQSDTATFDNCLELLTMAGYPLAQAVMMMIPEPWEQHTTMDERRKAFYEYHASMMEPWDGPARSCSPTAADRRHAGPQRPAASRYCVTDDDLVIMGSESGVLPCPRKIVRKWRPAARQDVPDRPGAGPHDRRRGAEGQPGQQQALQAVDREPAHQARRRAGQPVQALWRRRHRRSLLDRQQAFGYTQEDIKFLMTRWRRRGKRASAPWATTARWPCCRTRTSRCTATSSSCSPR
jgi:glutamate synthase (NADPH/NADH) large chain/glutamate synthase (ferredoxin)